VAGPFSPSVSLSCVRSIIKPRTQTNLTWPTCANHAKYRIVTKTIKKCRKVCKETNSSLRPKPTSQPTDQPANQPNNLLAGPLFPRVWFLHESTIKPVEATHCVRSNPSRDGRLGKEGQIGTRNRAQRANTPGWYSV
jgi:hypothetical protein